MIDERVIGTTMMSNSTLDAAKTSRMLQLLQTQANSEDLLQLAEGILLDEEEKVGTCAVGRCRMLCADSLCR